MPFSAESQDFLFEVWSRNDRAWYHENKEFGKKVLMEPFAQFVRELQPTMLTIDPGMDCSEKRIARVYRDARVIGNGPFFRDHIWCTMGRGKDAMYGYHSYFFELSSDRFRYGMGYYIPAKETLERIREMILMEDKTFRKAFSTHKKQKVYTLVGESYKRNHFPDAPEKYWDWLNRKTFCWIRESSDTSLLYSETLSEKIAADFLLIAPIYQFFLKAEEEARSEK
ncbi:MAG: DUF2461 domain-containing protein [Anaerolineaceae bacterium]|nr:DUF2461 domain-containing protein [Anaerolineaceae bacterium]